MRPTSTERHTLTFPIDLENVEGVKITYTQNEDIVIVKEKDDVTINGKKIIVTLSEAETKLFEPEIPVEIQAKILIEDKVLNTKIKRIAVKRMLNTELFLFSLCTTHRNNTNSVFLIYLTYQIYISYFLLYEYPTSKDRN